MALGVVDVFEFGFVRRRVDARPQRQGVLVAGDDGDGFEFEALGEVHRADRDALARIVAALRQFERLCARRLNRRTRAHQQLGRAHKNADLPRRNALAEGLLDEGRDGARFRRLVLRHDDLGLRPVEDGDCSFALLDDPVDVALRPRQKPVRGAADLVRGR